MWERKEKKKKKHWELIQNTVISLKILGLAEYLSLRIIEISRNCNHSILCWVPQVVFWREKKKKGDKTELSLKWKEYHQHCHFVWNHIPELTMELRIPDQEPAAFWEDAEGALQKPSHSPLHEAVCGFPSAMHLRTSVNYWMPLKNENLSSTCLFRAQDQSCFLFHWSI